MTTQDFKKIARLLKKVYSELEEEALKNGIDILSREYEEVVNQARLAILEKAGFSLEQYQEAKDTYLKTKKKNSVFEEVMNEGTISILQETKKDVEELKQRRIPTNEEIISLAHQVAQRYIKPPQVTNQIVKEITKPQIIKETIKEVDNSVVEDVKRDIQSLQESHGDLVMKVGNIKIPEIPPQPDLEGLKEGIRNEFSEFLEKNIDVLNMPDFRKLSMGLQAQIDERVIGVKTNKITVSDTTPSDPKLNDLWVDIS